MANVIRLKRASGSDPTASDLVAGEPAVRTDTGELFFKKDDGSIAKVAGAGGGPDFKYLALRNAANNGAASYPNADFTLVRSGTTTALVPTAANTLLVSVNGVIQKPNTGTSTPSEGFALSGSTIKFGGNISAAPDFILYQESGGIGEPSDETVSEEKLKVSNSPINGYFLSAQSGNTGGLTWAAPVATSCTGNSATATALATARTINGTSFDGTSNITVTAAAGTLTGTTLNSSVVTSSLTSLGDLAGLTVDGDMALTGANYNVLWDKSDNALEFADNAKAIFGTGNDLRIYHDATDSNIENTNGTLTISSTAGNNIRIRSDNLRLQSITSTEDYLRATKDGGVSLYYDNSNMLETINGGARVNGVLHVTSHLDMNDNDIIKLGDNDDLQIYHSGSHSYIENSTNFLFIHSNSLALRSISQETFIDCSLNGSVDLYYDNSKKFETTSDGATITGVLKVGNNNSKFGQNFLRFEHNGAGFLDHNFTGQDINFRTSISSSLDTTAFIIKSSGNVQIPADDKKLQIGASQDLEIYHDGSHSFVQNTTGLLILQDTSGIYLRTDDLRLQSSGGSETYATLTKDGAVSLNFDNSTKFATTSYGAAVTGGINFSGDSLVQDNVSIFFGASNDLGIKHDGSNSEIINTTGSLLIDGQNTLTLRSAGNIIGQVNDSETAFQGIANGAVELYYDNSKKLETTSNGVTISGSQTINGTTIANGHVRLRDHTGTEDGQLQLGTGNDLKLYHDGSNSFIQDVGTGNLYIQSTSAGVYIQKVGGEDMGKFLADGAVELYYDNSKKFATASDGITVYGRIAADELDMGDDERVKLGDGDDLQIYHNGTNSYVRNSTGQLLVGGSGGNLVLEALGDVRTVTWEGESMIEAKRNGAVELYYDNSKKLETTSQGVYAGGIIKGGSYFQGGASGTASYNWHFGAEGNGEFRFYSGNYGAGSLKQTINSNGDILAGSNNSQDLGSSSIRWRNVYTNDLNLSNEGGSNDVDGTWGSYTIQEGAEDLFLVNKRNGKKYKFNLTEVS